MFYFTIINNILRHYHSWLARQYQLQRNILNDHKKCIDIKCFKIRDVTDHKNNYNNNVEVFSIYQRKMLTTNILVEK